MKNTHLEEYIRPAKCIKAVEKLKELGNPFYQNVKVNEQFMEKIEVRNIFVTCKDNCYMILKYFIYLGGT